MSDTVSVGGQGVTTWPAWYCVADGQMFVWSNRQWKPVGSAPVQRAGGHPASSATAVLWYWDGKRWIVPGEPGDPVADGTRRPNFRLGLVVAVVSATVVALMTWAIGDRLDWAVCPGQNCNAGPIDWSNSLWESLLLGLLLGVLVTFLEWLSRWVNAKLRRRPPGPWDG